MSRLIHLPGDRGSRFFMVGLPQTHYSRKLALRSAKERRQRRESFLIVGAIVWGIVWILLLGWVANG